uniref:Opticin n=1 Tax=Petromyzon marinus TaxID=7757 RepID=S4RQE5_PETMA
SRAELGMPTCLLCSCVHGSVYCDDLELDSVPPLPKDTVYLYARFNKIRTLRKKDLSGYAQLKRVDLSSNGLTSVEAGALAQLPALEEVLLAGNELVALPELPPATRRLDARQNHVTSKGVAADMFEKMKQLEYLYLSDNQLDFIPVPLPDSLRVLHLQNNNIQQIREDTFCKPKELSYFRKALEDVRLDGNPVNLSDAPEAYTCLPRIPTGATF